MKTSIIRIVTLCALSACFMGVAGSALAQDHGMRDLRAQMGRLQTAKSAALAHHHRTQAHYIQSLINRLQVRIDNHK